MFNSKNGRLIFLAFLLFLTILIVSPLKKVSAAEVSASSTPGQDAYRAVVKIKTYVLGKDFSLVEVAEGSGIIISSDGLVLTNHHVISYENEFGEDEKKVGLQVCLTTDISKEPNCYYGAKLISKDKTLDLALIKIQPLVNITDVPGLHDGTAFNSLELSSSDTTSINDEITALGYPGIGEGTITITKGVISGKTEKYNKQWLKTDAVTSFGNSGGAAINKDGRVVGITSAAHSDLAGSLGYIISVSSINDWVLANRGKKEQAGDLYNRIADLSKKQKILVNSNKYININPYFSLDKPADWNFKHVNENELDIDKKSDEDGGTMSLVIGNTPYAFDANNLLPFFKKNLDAGGYLGLVGPINVTNLKLGGREARKFTIGNSSMYLVPFGQRVLLINYEYGKNDKDKKIVDGIINSLKFGPAPVVKEIKTATLTNPKLTLKTTGDWVLEQKNTVSEPWLIANKKIKELDAYVKIEKTVDNNKNFNNKQLMAQIKSRVDSFNKLSSEINTKMTISEIKESYTVNTNFSQVVKMKSILKDATTGKILMYSTDYYKRIGDKFVTIGFNIYTDNKTTYNKADAEFTKLIKNFSLGK